MRVTRKITATKLTAYLRGTLPLATLVDWAENAVADGEFESGHESLLMEIVGRLGTADTGGYELSWEDCVKMLKRLGYKARINVALAR